MQYHALSVFSETEMRVMVMVLCFIIYYIAYCAVLVSRESGTLLHARREASGADRAAAAAAAVAATATASPQSGAYPGSSLLGRHYSCLRHLLHLDT